MKFGISVIPHYSLHCIYAIVGLYDGTEFEIPIFIDGNIFCEWGETNCYKDCDIKIYEISNLDIAWKTTTDELYFRKKFTEFSSIINKHNLIGSKQECILKVGIAPFGFIALWMEYSDGTRILLEIDEVSKNNTKSLSDEYNKILKKFNQFTYRFYIHYPVNSLGICTFMKVFNYDGSKHLYTDSKSYSVLTQYGIPSKILIKSEYSKAAIQLFIWFEEEKITRFFEYFYGDHPETKTDFIIGIDAENRKYELALYRQGLKEPMIIPESAYQLIVFKNKFEDYRSANYNQPRGAWIW